jgi:hypothetical protein
VDLGNLIFYSMRMYAVVVRAMLDSCQVPVDSNLRQLPSNDLLRSLLGRLPWTGRSSVRVRASLRSSQQSGT